VNYCHRLLAATVLIQHHMLPKEVYDATSYLVEYGGSGHAYALHLHSLRFICTEVLCSHEVGMRSIIYMRVLFYSYVDIVYLLYVMLIKCVWKFHWINTLVLKLYLL
jgi:hypothetical protein